MAHKRIRARYRNCDRIPYKKGGRDNKDYYNTRGGAFYARNTIRIPSLGANNKTWNNFYKLFPNIKKFLMGDKYALYGTFRKTEFDEKNNVFIVRKEHYVGDKFNTSNGRFCIRTFKFKKTW